MGEIKKYQYTLSRGELFAYGVQTMLQKIKQRLFLWLLLVLVCLLEAAVLPEVVICLVVAMAAAFVYGLFRNCQVFKQSLADGTMTLWVDGNTLTLQRGVVNEIPCSSIQSIRQTRRLLLLGYRQMQGAWMICPVPLSVFGDENEKQRFVEQIRCPQAKREEVLHRQAELSFSYGLNEEKWVCIRRDMVEIISGSTLGKSTMLRAFPFLFLRNPEKRIRRQAKLPTIQKDFEGFWRVTLIEEGVSRTSPEGGRDFYPWESMGWLVKGNSAFFLMQKDKRNAIVIPKECFQSVDSVRAVQELAGKKGLQQVKQQKRKYMPAWVLWAVLTFLVLLSVFFTFAASVIEEVQSLMADSENFREYESRILGSADNTPDVSVEQQAEMLRALGLTVPEGAVEAAQKQRDELLELDREIIVEPYLGLLMSLAYGYPDENGNPVGGTGEIFWFDFEGWDVSTDYIHVLTGMLALAKGSPLDGVCNIEEDISQVDWEKGRGKVKVSLTWEEQEYSWDMEVYNDWIDSAVLEILNSLLAECDSQEYFYIADDDGQGAIVFFCTEKWAEEFTRITKVKLVRG